MRLLPPLVGLLATLAGGAPAPPRIDAAGRLTVYVQRIQRFRAPDDAEVLAKVQGLLAVVAEQRAEAPATVPACDLAALDVAAHGWLPAPERAALVEALEAQGGRGAPADEIDLASRVSLLGIAHLSGLLASDDGDAVARWLAAEVLARRREHGVARRRAACGLLAGRHVPTTQSALFATARDEDELLREAAFRALAGWDDPEVHRFLLRQHEDGRVSLPIVLDHLAAAPRELDPESVEVLRRHVRALLGSQDWRDAVRGVRLAGAVDGLVAAPLLIDALEVWGERIEAGGGRVRVQDEIVGALRALSGRSIPARADRWRLWWSAVREGRVVLPPEGDVPGAVTQATFFGLRPVTDRVIFVIDRSGSMEQHFGTTGRSRYEEAVEELIGFATKLGPEARFGVALFHDDASRWRPRLTEADEPGVAGARRWLSGQDPDGGTRLFAGLRAALELGPDGRVDPAEVQADTVIVLCDGETAEGPFWVEPWLERANEDAQLVFHCVQVGGYGDGTLERLAAGSGGDFVRIEG